MTLLGGGEEVQEIPTELDDFRRAHLALPIDTVDKSDGNFPDGEL